MQQMTNILLSKTGNSAANSAKISSQDSNNEDFSSTLASVSASSFSISAPKKAVANTDDKLQIASTDKVKDKDISTDDADVNLIFAQISMANDMKKTASEGESLPFGSSQEDSNESGDTLLESDALSTVELTSIQASMKAMNTELPIVDITGSVQGKSDILASSEVDLVTEKGERKSSNGELSGLQKMLDTDISFSSELKKLTEQFQLNTASSDETDSTNNVSTDKVSVEVLPKERLLATKISVETLPIENIRADKDPADELSVEAIQGKKVLLDEAVEALKSQSSTDKSLESHFASLKAQVISPNSKTSESLDLSELENTAETAPSKILESVILKDADVTELKDDKSFSTDKYANQVASVNAELRGARLDLNSEALRTSDDVDESMLKFSPASQTLQSETLASSTTKNEMAATSLIADEIVDTLDLASSKLIDTSSTDEVDADTVSVESNKPTVRNAEIAIPQQVSRNANVDVAVSKVEVQPIVTTLDAQSILGNAVDPKDSMVSDTEVNADISKAAMDAGTLLKDAKYSVTLDAQRDAKPFVMGDDDKGSTTDIKSFSSLTQSSTPLQVNRQETMQVQLSLRQGVDQQNQMQEIIQRFSPVMKQQLITMVSQGIQHAEIRLDPPELGHMLVKIQVHGDQTQVQFHVTQTQTRDLVEQAMPRLRELLQEQGMQLADSHVSQGGQGERREGGFGDGGGSNGTDVDEISAEELHLGLNQATSVNSGIDYYA
ncbi:flagellar hook-length control protein FliK [Shewanella baltica]|uniref:flagellar hook-length control protein FliK n=1 Tax=Shewanella baltica TaxID=62322 RepID=UPI00217DB357|nr:flagellar hook-length control protein FliK [Shewanella baltica]MCS6126392.1 flagellar hook-length control protein FliK [Shewanella baltica]MCS6137713.1 flagellar hook-length control protein FliK [Shewanella baltica]MCS6144770.1 flagellar hook-length control protein FliK [Shewanella baltica]MCS6169298.1 flagellar hook-length control protein FliK [Shewanella baltica]MCS6186408.1 flagellar hook-length control protein FliK [Shewanella baltica]